MTRFHLRHTLPLLAAGVLAGCHPAEEGCGKAIQHALALQSHAAAGDRLLRDEPETAAALASTQQRVVADVLTARCAAQPSFAGCVLASGDLDAVEACTHPEGGHAQE